MTVFIDVKSFNMKKKNLFIPIIIFFLINVIGLFGQTNSKQFEKIKTILYQQQTDWNKGDIDAFMEAYWKSDQLQFGGATGITRGWQATLDRYKKSYPDKATMGQLTFEIKDLTRHSKKVVSLTGSWELKRENDQPGGHFLLIWRKMKGEWKIVADHTSVK